MLMLRSMLAFISVLISLVIFIAFLPLSIISRIIRIIKSRPLQPRNVFIGFQEIANNINSLKEILNKNNINVKIKMLPNYYYLKEYFINNIKIYNLLIPIIYSKYLIWILFSADQVWIIWYVSILRLNLDYILYRISGVDFVIQHCGDDVRCRHLHNEIFRKYSPGYSIASDFKYKQHNIFSKTYYKYDIIRKLYRQAISEVTGKTLSMRNQATFQLGELGHFFFYQKQLVKEPRQPSFRPVVVHAPTDRKMKRTDMVLEAIDILKKRGLEFEFLLFENTPNDEIIQSLLTADIVVDQPGTWSGRFAIEAAAASCAVIGGNNYIFENRPSTPIIQFPNDVVELVKILERVINDTDYRAKLMKDCWNYWYINHSEEYVFKKYISVWENTYGKFSPFSDQKKILLRGANDIIEIIMIKTLYHKRKYVIK